MALLGAIVKGALKIHEIITDTEDHVAAQKTVLNDLLSSAAETQFGRHYDFESILESQDITRAFTERVPFHDYNKIHEEWWHKLQEGESDVTWPGKPNYFARSSGTTGKTSKRIPVTDEMISAIRSAGTRQVSALTNFKLETDAFEKEVMALGNSTDLDET